jgi:hypothetical protein
MFVSRHADNIRAAQVRSAAVYHGYLHGPDEPGNSYRGFEFYSIAVLRAFRRNTTCIAKRDTANPVEFF